MGMLVCGSFYLPGVVGFACGMGSDNRTVVVVGGKGVEYGSA